MPSLDSNFHVAEAEFPVHETHGIARLQENRLILSSEGMGWRNIYASLTTEQSWSATVPAVDHYCLAYCLHSSAVITRRMAGGKIRHSAVLKPRQFGTIPARIESQWDVEGSPQILLLYLRRPLVDQVIQDVFEKDAHQIEIKPILGAADPLLEQLACSVLEVLRRRTGFNNMLYIESMAQAMAVQLLYRYGAGLDLHMAGRAADVQISAPGLRRVLDYIDAALDDDLSLNALAQQANYRPHFFARTFRKQVGMAPHQYVMHRRIERAKALLAQTDLPLAHIALETGFSSQSHLSSTFKRVVGVTPGDYRKS